SGLLGAHQFVAVEGADSYGRAPLQATDAAENSGSGSIEKNRRETASVHSSSPMATLNLVCWRSFRLR
ncbi:hypothetical protein PMAYCL1PPCAC_00797, partial [Pristionchus mayeri]